MLTLYVLKLANMYEIGEGCESNKKKALELYKEAKAKVIPEDDSMQTRITI